MVSLMYNYIISLYIYIVHISICLYVLSNIHGVIKEYSYKTLSVEKMQRYLENSN